MMGDISEKGRRWMKAAWITMIHCLVLIGIGLTTNYEDYVKIGALGLFVVLAMSAMSYG